MGSFVYFCKKNEVIINQDLYISFEIDKDPEQNKKLSDSPNKTSTQAVIKQKFDSIKSSNKIDNNNNIDNEIIPECPKNNNEERQEKCSLHNKNDTEDINNIVNNNKNENDKKRLFDIQSNNCNLTLNSSSNLKSMNNNEQDTLINYNLGNNLQPQNQNQETPNPSQACPILNNNASSAKESNVSKKSQNNVNKHKKPKKKNSDVLTPIPEYPTPSGNYDKSKMPGHLIFMNFNDVTNDEVMKIENEIGEFIIEQKELIKYMEQYPYVPKNCSIQYPSGEKYSGYFSPDWEKEVFGIQINKDGSKYVGLYKNGAFDGRGRLILHKGDYYEGEFKQNKANGFGKYVNTKGEIYIGNWKDDRQEGEGELILKDGSRYNGQFKEGKKNGKGKITWNDSSYYEGDFINNYYDGYGVYMMRNKKAYIGEWKRGQMNGFGILSYPDGKSYKGYYENDKNNGFGIYSGKNNLRYEGKFKKGKQHGIGRIINEKGEKQLGLYLKGKRLKYLNEKDFKDDIAIIEQEIEKINNIINNNEFFAKNIGILTIIQEKYFTPE